MDMFIWTQKYGSDIEKMDQDHQNFIRILNELYAQLDRPDNRPATDKSLQELCLYTKQHFAIEEAYMKRYGYPEPHASAHIDEHQKFARGVEDMRKEFEAGAPGVTRDILTYLLEWLQEHIGDADLKLAQFLKQNGCE